MNGPGTVRKTPVYGDTFDIGGRGWVGIAVAIHGWSGDCQSNSGARGYSDIGGYSSGYPWRVPIHGRSGVCQSNFSVRGYFDMGGIAEAIHGEWQSTDDPGSVRVTPVYSDTLT